MNRAYVVLINETCQSNSREPIIPNVTPQAAGMQLKGTFGGVSIFASSDTPTLQLPDGGIIIGDLYSHNGAAVQDASQLANLSDTAVRRHILEKYWGDYILLLPGADGSSVISVMRSPSAACDLQCVYSLRDGKGFFTSDISLAARLGLYHKRVDFDYILHRLTYPDLKTSRTGLADVSELLPGCTVYLRDKSVEVTQDWSPWDFIGAGMRYVDHREAASAIRSATELVINTWANQDKSILLELSGGLDSSIVGVCLKDTQAQVTCSTLTTPVPGADEREYASLIADVLGVALLATKLRYDDALFEFPLPQELITPEIGPLQYAIDTIMQATAEHQGANSYFSGGGGDTVFCYLTNAVPAADAFRAAGFSAGIGAVRDISMFHQCTYWKASRLTLRKLIHSQEGQFKVDRSFLSTRGPLPEPEHHPWLSTPPRALLGDRQRIFELSGAQFIRDSCPRGLARRLRMPLLSQPVVEACLRAPSWMWFAGGQNRAVARQAFSDVLPPGILTRKSKGTFTAYLGAIYHRNSRHMLDFLLGGVLQARNLLDVRELRRVTQTEALHDESRFIRIFQLCTIENWARQQS
jgi:asparagine synthase (glutamine-hydrolysing)